MNGQTRPEATEVSQKIAWLVRDRGWTQEECARRTGLNRQTVRQILSPTGPRRLRNATLVAFAGALGLSVGELQTLPPDRLEALSRLRALANPDDHRRRLYEEATQPELRAWAERNPDRALTLSPQEYDELLSLQGTGGPLTAEGVEEFVALIERKRDLIQKVHAVAGTDHLPLLEKLVDAVYERVTPYADRA